MQMTPGQPSGRRENDKSPLKKPSLVDDLFSEPTKREKEDPKSRAEEDLSHPPSLVDDVFNEPPKARKRMPIWLFVFAAIALSVVGSLLVYRSNSATTPAWKEEPRPKLEMAEPPPVPPPAGQEEKAALKEPAETVAPQPAPPVRGEIPVRTPVKPLQTARQPETAKIAKQPPASAPLETKAQTKAEAKPKLLREPEDLAKEQKAFDFLREKSQAARQLLEGNLDQFRFLEYQVIPKEAGQYWVDLVAAPQGADHAVHFIWAVNPDRQTTRALSQAARDIDH